MDMKTISVQMSDVEFDAFGLSKDRFFFSEIAGLIERQRLQKGNSTIDDKIEKFKQITESLRKINDKEPLSEEFDEILSQRVHFKEMNL